MALGYIYGVGQKSPQTKQDKIMETAIKKIKLELVGLDGNAYSLMGAFSHQARKEGWAKDEIDAVMAECNSGDYDNLIRTLMDHCESTDGD